MSIDRQIDIHRLLVTNKHTLAQEPLSTGHQYLHSNIGALLHTIFMHLYC